MRGSAVITASAHPSQADWTLGEKVHWTLRISAGLCFIGHGAFGIITKPDWVPFFAIFGIPESIAYTLMPLVGSVDIGVGLLVLWKPRPILLAYMTVWCVWTALLRPLDGRGIWEFLERAGNYGVPLALLLLSRPVWDLRRNRFWLAPLAPPRLDGVTLDRVAFVLRVTVALLLIGHGGFGAFMHKAQLLGHYSAVAFPLGLEATPAFVTAVGWLEIGLGAAILVFPAPLLLAVALVWKLATELLYPISGDYAWEFIERAGSYGAPLALLYIETWQRRRRSG